MFWLLIFLAGISAYLYLFVREIMNGMNNGPGLKAFSCLMVSGIGIMGMVYGWPDIFWWLR